MEKNMQNMVDIHSFTMHPWFPISKLSAVFPTLAEYDLRWLGNSLIIFEAATFLSDFFLPIQVTSRRHLKRQESEWQQLRDLIQQLRDLIQLPWKHPNDNKLVFFVFERFSCIFFWDGGHSKWKGELANCFTSVDLSVCSAKNKFIKAPRF